MAVCSSALSSRSLHHAITRGRHHMRGHVRRGPFLLQVQLYHGSGGPLRTAAGARMSPQEVQDTLRYGHCQVLK